MWKQALFSVLFIYVQFGTSIPVESDPGKEPLTDSPKDNITSNVSLETSNSEKKVVKVENEILGTASSDEKLGTSSTVPIGYATSNGIIYDAPLASGDYSAFGRQPNLFVQGQTQTALHQGHQGQILSHGQHVGHQGVERFNVQGPGENYRGVVYGGTGNHQAHPIGHGQHVSGVHHAGQTQLMENHFAQIQKTQITQNALSGIPGSVGIQQPFSPYGYGGVVYMGNGLIPEHIAGVKLAGPVRPPPGYQHNEHALVNKDSLGSGHAKASLIPAGLGGNHHPQQGFGHNTYQGSLQEYDVLQGHQHQEINPYPHLPYRSSLNAPSRHPSGYDAYGNVVKDLKVKHRTDTSPGLGYNGLPNDVIAHTDQAILQHQHHHQHPQRHHDGRGLSNPDPYYNNLNLPGFERSLGIGHATTLLTTGPNRYYQGKNPVGVYERYHRLG